MIVDKCFMHVCFKRGNFQMSIIIVSTYLIYSNVITIVLSLYSVYYGEILI